MRPYTAEQKIKLLANGAKPDYHHPPVVMMELFAGSNKMCWLLSELDPEEPTYAFSLCDLGEGFPEFRQRLFASGFSDRAGIPVFPQPL